MKNNKLVLMTLLVVVCILKAQEPGILNWTYNLEYEGAGGPVVGVLPSGNIVFVDGQEDTYNIDNTNKVKCLNVDGELIWEWNRQAINPHSGESVVISSTGLIYFFADSIWKVSETSYNSQRYMYVLNSDGTCIRKFAGPQGISNISLDGDDNVYFTSYNPVKLSKYTADMNFIWEKEINVEHGLSRPTISADGTIYTGYDYSVDNNYHGKLISISSGGDINWEIEAGGYIRTGTAVIDMDGNLLIIANIGNYDNSLKKYTPGGELLWQSIKYDFETMQPVINSYNEIYWANGDPGPSFNLLKYTEIGEIIWNQTFNSVGFAGILLLNNNDMIIKSSGSPGGNHIECFNQEGTELWEYNPWSFMYKPPTLDNNGNIIVITRYNIISVTSGQKRFDYSTWPVKYQNNRNTNSVLHSVPDSLSEMTWYIDNDYVTLDWSNSDLSEDSDVFLYRSSDPNFVPTMNDTIGLFNASIRTFGDHAINLDSIYFYKTRILKNNLLSKPSFAHNIGPFISTSTDSLRFGTLIGNDKDTLKLTIYNTSLASDLIIDNIQSSSTAFSVSDADFTVLKNDSIAINVYFHPIDGGIYSDSLILTNNTAYQRKIQVNLSGTKGSYISGVITDNTIWDKVHSPYIINGHFGVDAGITLTMESGIQVLFDGNYNFNVFGNLDINGVETDTVLISTINTPAPGLWPKLNFASGSTGDISYLKLQGSSDGIYVNDAVSFSIQNSLIEQNSNYGIYLNSVDVPINQCIIKNSGTALSLNSSSSNIQNCGFLDNNTGIYCNYSSISIDSCIVSENNDRGITIIYGSGLPKITNSTISDNGGVGIFFDNNSGTFAIENTDIINNGSYGAQFNESSASILMTNCNITFNEDGIYSNSHLEITDCKISSNNDVGVFGQGSTTNIYNCTFLNNGSHAVNTTHDANIKNNTISNNGGYGIWPAGNTTIQNNIITNNQIGIYTSGNPTIHQNKISGNTEDGIIVQANALITNNDIINNGGNGIEASGLPTIHNNNIYGNTEYNASAFGNPTATINAENNYWGTTIENEIKAKIWDFYDTGGSVAKVDYLPFSVDYAELSPVSGFHVQSYSDDQVILTWDKNLFASQYLLYYDYQTGTIDASSVWVTLDSNITYYVVNIDDGFHKFGIKARSFDGRISSLSICIFDNTHPPYKLFFSEVIEGSSYNKAFEIYNASDTIANLNFYKIGGCSNGCDNGDWEYWYEFPDTAFLYPESVWVITSTEAIEDIKIHADELLSNTTPIILYNGDDNRGLFHIVNNDTTLLDIIGDGGVNDPGVGWDVAGIVDATFNHTIIRKSTIVRGNTDWNSSAGTNSDDSEWIVMPQDYFDNIGEHGTFIIDEPPDGPDTCLAFSDNSKTTQLTSGERYYYENPFFVWNSAIDSAGIAGYAVSFCGSQYDTVDVSNFQTDTTYTANNLYPGMTYYLRVRAKDNSGIWNEARTLFIYIYGDPVTLADTPWPKFKGDSKNTGQSSYLGPKTNNVKWQFKTTFYLHSSSPVVGCDGTIYIGSYDSTLYAINPDGSEKWLFNTGGSVFSPPLIGSDGTIYFGSYDTNLYAINSDGDKKWQFSTDHPVLSSPSIGSDGIVYVGTYYGPTYYNLYAINPDGSEKWRFNIGAATFSSPSIGSDGTIYIGSLDYNLYSINPDGSEKWRFSAGSSITSSSSSIGNDGTIYIGSNDNNLYAISPDGSEKWRFMTGGSIRSSSAIDNDGVIYIGSNDNNLYAINPDGSEKWRFSTTGMIYSSPTIGSDGIIYIGSYDSTLYAINPDGSEKWKFKTEGRISSSPAIDKNGTLYIGSFDSTLYAFQDLDEEGPLVVLNTPNGGETLYCDGEYEIRWEATDNITVSNIALYYSVDNGISYIPIDTTELNDSSYTWIIPNTPSNKCKVKIIARDGVGNTGFDISDGTFIIADTTRPFVQVTSPNGGEMFGIGLTDTIKYSISDNVEIDFSQIYYSIDNGVSFELIDSISGTSDEYIWEVPLAFSNECFIKIIAIDNSGNSNEDVSDLPFIITDLSDPAVTLISPVGGEEYVGSLDYDIQWNASDNYKLDKAYFYFSLNNGETFSVVDSTNAVNTSYRWTVPDIHSDICQLAIIVKDSVGNVASDTTKDVFKIGRGPTAMLTTPNTEQSGDISIVYQLWDKQGDTLSFTPYYSINSGVNWTIATVDGNTSNIDSLHYNNSIVWKSETDLPHNEIYTVRFKIIPSDTALGIGGQTSDFHLDNNEIPSVILTEILDVVTITIPIYYELSDSEKDTLNILVEYFNKEESVFKTATLIDEQTNLTENQYSGKLYWRSDLDCPEISDNILFRITPFDNDTGVSDTIVIIVDNFRSRMSIDWIYGEQTGDIPLNYRITNDTLSTVSITYQYGSSLTNTWYLATINGDVTDINYHNYTGTHIWQSAIDLPGEDISNIQIRAMPFDVRGGVEFISHDIHIDNNNVPVVDTIFTPQAEVTGDVELRFGIKDDESDTLDYDIQYSIDSGNSWQHPSLNFLYQHIPPENDTLSFTWLSNDDIPNLDLNTIKFKIIPMDNDTGIIGESGIFHVDNETGPVILSSFPKVYALWQDTIIIDFDRSINATTLSGNLLVSGSRSGDITGSDIFLNDYHSLFFMPDNPFMADETISVVLKAGLSDNLGKGLDGDNDGDPEGSPTDDYSWQFTSPYLGDYDNSDVVDVQDLIIFAEKWQQEKQDMLFEIGPAIGELPYLELEPDSIIDFEDFVTLARMWNYSVGTAELLAMFTNENDEELISQPSLAKQADPSITKPAKEILDYETKSIIKKDPKVKQTVSKHPVISLNPKISDDPWANSKNGSFEVEVKLDELIDVSGAQLVFQYDKDLLNFDGFLKTPENEQPMSKSLAKTLMSQEINNISNLNVGTDKLIMQHAEENVVLLDIVQISDFDQFANKDGNILILQFSVIKSGVSDIKFHYSTFGDNAVALSKGEGSEQIDSKLLIPEFFAVYQNYPNPFNPVTTIKYQVPADAEVFIRIYDLQGKLVTELISDHHNPGYYLTRWNGRNEVGQMVSSGLYFYQFHARYSNKSYMKTRKMMVLK